MNFVDPWKLFVATRQPGPMGLLGVPEQPRGSTFGNGIFDRMAVAIGLILPEGIILPANGARQVPSAFTVPPAGQLGSEMLGR